MGLGILFYWILLGVASGRRRTCSLPFRFLEGAILAYLCFCFLPIAFEEIFLWAGLGALLGIALGVLLEERFCSGALREEVCSAVLFTLAWLYTLILVQGFPFLRSLLGGTALYCAVAGLVREDLALSALLTAAAGGIGGFIVGTALCLLL